jgi:hypothetical protein
MGDSYGGRVVEVVVVDSAGDVVVGAVSAASLEQPATRVITANNEQVGEMRITMRT